MKIILTYRQINLVTIFLKPAMIKYDRRDNNWYIIFHHKLPAPVGADFGVTVDNKSGKAKLFLGE